MENSGPFRKWRNDSACGSGGMATDRSVAEVTHSAVQVSRASDQDGDVLFGCRVKLGAFVRVFFWPEFRYVQRSHSALVRPFVRFRRFGLRSTQRT